MAYVGFQQHRQRYVSRFFFYADTAAVLLMLLLLLQKLLLLGDDDSEMRLSSRCFKCPAFKF